MYPEFREVKKIEGRIDWVLEPNVQAEPTYILEFYAYWEVESYENLILKKLIYKKQNPARPLVSVLIFLDESLDPKPVEWMQYMNHQSANMVCAQIPTDFYAKDV